MKKKGGGSNAPQTKNSLSNEKTTRLPHDESIPSNKCRFYRMKHYFFTTGRNLRASERTLAHWGIKTLFFPLKRGVSSFNHHKLYKGNKDSTVSKTAELQ